MPRLEDEDDNEAEDDKQKQKDAFPPAGVLLVSVNEHRHP